MNNNFARWTPYQDRADVWGAQREEEMASREEAGESPTSSQIAKKRLGFENLFDVVDMGLLSGRSVEAEICHILAILSALRTVINIFRFLTQKPGEVEKEVMRQTQADFNSSSRPQSRPQSRSMDTQDTVILTGAGQDVSSAINRILEDVADISEEEEEEENDMVGNEELKEGVEKNSVDEKTAGPDLTSEQESGDGKTKEEEEQDEGVKVSKKRKRRLISDPDGLHVRKLPPV